MSECFEYLWRGQGLHLFITRGESLIKDGWFLLNFMGVRRGLNASLFVVGGQMVNLLSIIYGVEDYTKYDI